MLHGEARSAKSEHGDKKRKVSARSILQKSSLQILKENAVVQVESAVLF